MESAQDKWAAVDRYLNDLLLPADAVLEAALRSSDAAGLPSINVTPNQGKLLHLLARMGGARRILEVGTLGGYSTIWLARALLPGGRVVTLELEETHAQVARSNFDRASLSDVIEVRVGPAIATLHELVAARVEPFDFVFIDADKPSIADYFDLALQLTRVGSVIVVDNVIRNGAVIDANSADPSVQGVRRFNAKLAFERRVSATTLQTVGSKGYDGFTLALVTATQ
jgi:predicted O-methyltransferase YrrM